MATSVGLVGLGNMGMPMARNLAAAPDIQLAVWARDPDQRAEARAAGATIADTIEQLTSSVEVLISMLPDLPQLNDLVVSGGLLDTPGPVRTLIVCSTSSPEGMRELDAHLRGVGSGVGLLDAPVSGGTDGAASGTLSIMVGGDPGTFRSVEHVLRVLGTPSLLGPIGSGQVAKACNQLVVAATIMALGEASVIAERSGLDLERMWTLLSRGYAGSRVLDTRMRRFIDKDYTVSGPAKFMIKDLDLALAEADRTGTRAGLLDAVRNEFRGLVSAGFGDSDISVTQAYVARR